MALHWCSTLPDQSFAWPCVYLGLPLRCFQQHASRCHTQRHGNAFYKRKWASVSRGKWLGYKQGYRSSKSSSNFELRKGWLAAFYVRVSSERTNCIQCFSRSLKAIGKLTFYDKHLISQTTVEVLSIYNLGRSHIAFFLAFWLPHPTCQITLRTSYLPVALWIEFNKIHQQRPSIRTIRINIFTIILERALNGAAARESFRVLQVSVRHQTTNKFYSWNNATIIPLTILDVI